MSLFLFTLMSGQGKCHMFYTVIQFIIYELAKTTVGVFMAMAVIYLFIVNLYLISFS